MITPADYGLLVNIVRNAGTDVWISQDEYLATPYLPNWYPLIHDLTPESQFFSIDDNLERALSELGWSSSSSKTALSLSKHLTIVLGALGSAGKMLLKFFVLKGA